MESVSFPEPPPLIGTPENLNKFHDYHGDRGHNTNDCYQLKNQIEEVVASGKLAHLVKDIRRNNQRNGNLGRNGVKVINMIRHKGNRKRSFEERRFFNGNISSFRSNRSLSNFGKGRKKQDGANGVCNNKMLFAVQHHNRKDQNEKPPGIERLYKNANTWKGYKDYGRRYGGVNAKNKCPGKGNKKVHYPEWIANTIPIKLASGTWKVQVDYSSLNKVCAKDMYPLPEEGEWLASLMGYPYKCFLRLPKEYNQIRMAEGDEEKTRFHIEEEIYCFTHIPKELKNFAATLLRMMEKVLANQRGWNVETYLEEIVIKSKSELGLVQDVKETLRKLKRVNIKIDLTMSSFRVKEGRNEAEGPVVKKFFGQGEQVEETPDVNKGGIFDLSKGFQANSTATTRAWRLYLGRETIKEGSSVGIILISPEEKMYSYAIRLKFKASNHAMDCKALLAGLAASANQGIKDLHVFIDSLTLVT
ncbi:hypothetical protein Tco_0597529 [Tanacetum coccineum]